MKKIILASTFAVLLITVAKATMFFVAGTSCYKDINDVTFDKVYLINEGDVFKKGLLGIDPNGMADPNNVIEITGYNLPEGMTITEGFSGTVEGPEGYVSPCDGPYDPNYVTAAKWTLQWQPTIYQSGEYLPIIGLKDKAGNTSYAGLKFVVADVPQPDTEVPFLALEGD